MPKFAELCTVLASGIFHGIARYLVFSYFNSKFS